MKRLSAGIAVLLMLLCSPGGAQAVPAGSLDPTFSHDGIAKSDLLSNSYPTKVQIDAQNRVTVAGFDANVSQALILRYKANGTPDSNWGQRFISSDFGYPVGLAMDGTKTMVGFSGGVVARLKPNGALDRSFGGTTFGGKGVIEFSMNIVAMGRSSTGVTFALGDDQRGHSALFNVAADGKSYSTTPVCLGGRFYASTCGGAISMTVSPTYLYIGGWAPEEDPDSDSAVVGRFSPTGTLDTSYGSQGYAWFDTCVSDCGNSSEADAVAVSPKSGEVTAVGQNCGGYCPHDGPNFYAHFTSTGVLDWSGEADFGDCGGSCIHSSAHPSGVAILRGVPILVGIDDGDDCTSPSGGCIGMQSLGAGGVGTFFTTKVPISVGPDVRIFNTKIVVAAGQYVARFQG